LTRSKLSGQFDLIKFHRVQADLHAREGKWHEALQDLGNALRLAGESPRLGPAYLIPIMTGYARALRKNHRVQEARAIENRATELRNGLVASAVVDVADYLELKPAKK